jgi:hypothetical protein
MFTKPTGLPPAGITPNVVIFAKVGFRIEKPTIIALIGTARMTSIFVKSASTEKALALVITG